MEIAVRPAMRETVGKRKVERRIVRGLRIWGR
jgi:hypothetical protein